LSIDKRLFDEEAGIIFHAQIGPLGVPDPEAEGQGDADVEGGKLQALPDAHFLVFLVQETKVKGGQGNNNADEMPARTRPAFPKRISNRKSIL
jgi:hypothetical protein